MTIALTYVPGKIGEAAAAAAIREADAHAAPLLVINARRGGALVEETAASDDELSAIVQQARSAGLTVTVEQPDNPDVVDAILELVETHPVTMVVIGVRQRSPVGKLLLGSVAQRIILEAPCAVLAIKPAP